MQTELKAVTRGKSDIAFRTRKFKDQMKLCQKDKLEEKLT